MAKLIEYYVPKNFRHQFKWFPQERAGKVIEFPQQAKKSA